MSKKTVSIVVDGVTREVPAGSSVAAAVLGHVHDKHFHTHPVDGSKRAPWCLMGVCFECMLEIDGVPNVQSCLVTVAEGMVVKTGRQTAGKEEQ